MDFSVRHALPGRIRLHVPVLVGPSQAAEAILDGIRGIAPVLSVHANYAASTVAITYDDDYQPEVEQLLALLKGLSIDAIAAYFDSRAEPAAERNGAGEVKAKRLTSGSLVLPTVTLALSLVAAPALKILTVPLLLYGAVPTWRRAMGVIRSEHRLNVDFLDTLAVGASLVRSDLVAGSVVLWLIHLGDLIRDRTAAGSKRALGDLLEYQKRNAWVFRDGAVCEVSADALAVNDVVVVYPGEMVPVDGEVIHGSGLLDQKTITGESLPVVREIGDPVFAASILQTGQLRLRASRVGADTAAGQIAQLIDAAPLGDTRMQSHAERFADRLVTPTIGLAVVAALAARDFGRFLSIVIIDLGTGIRVAAPTAILSSITHAARSGIIIKSGAHMEKLAQIDTVVFDKTGTLSLGTPRVTQSVSFLDEVPADQVLALAVAAETGLHHPVAQALRARADELRLDIPNCPESKFRVGFGVEAQVDAAHVLVGSERFMRDREVAIDHAAAERAHIDEMGWSCLYVAIDGKLAGLIAYEDAIRTESRAVIAALHRMGITESIMLTGDNATVAKAVSGRLGLTRYVADCLPADKADVIRQMQQEGRKVAMVGDGINDSPALTFADVGIAMKFGSDIAHQSADVVLMEDSLWKLVRAIEISRSAVAIIEQNYGIVGGMNAVAMALCLPGGIVTPQVTALISNGSAIVAGANGLRPLARSS